ncbi:MAG: CDP-alcohol phosphatidyltransferase family protein [Chloroflexi bacterium]|nr:CDP-alcohol phosphatidyltransferase family protein [Chloroflexota bacterium]
MTPSAGGQGTSRSLRLRPLIGRYLQEPVARGLVRLGVTPNQVTLLGLLLAAPAAYFASTGHFLLAGLFLMLSGLADALDGTVARLRGRVTRFGALLDSTMDRVEEAGILLGLLVWYLRQSESWPAVLAYVAFAGSVLVSYVRARAEGLGMQDRAGGLMPRPARVAVLALGLLLNQAVVALAVIVALALLTVGQRLYRAWRAFRRE